MANRLAAETSPYLLQHRDNPVEWYPWGSEALERARTENKPLLVSIGYSACHWCHVMERESFEDPETAAVMSEHFVCVKVDREERPDIDAICMEAVQAMTGHGGWPLNVFLTPEQVPFYGGTYFPPEQRGGMAGWRQILEAVATAWRERADEIRAGSEQILPRLRGAALLEPSDDEISGADLDTAIERIEPSYDSVGGGFGEAPKFPMASVVELLLTYSVKQPSSGAQGMAFETLRAMATGGIYDQIGGGFARYSVDAQWVVPHFEKMLYDNALLARAYLHAYQLSGEGLFERVCRETLEWMLRELCGPEGGFYSAFDADSEGVEGKFYAWTRKEIETALGDNELAEIATRYLGVSDRGNFEGKNILVAAGEPPERLAEIRCKLYGARSKRTPPGLDDKRLVAWNALAISALADAGSALEHEEYLTAARQCAEFVLSELRRADGRLLRTYSAGQAKLDGYLEDYAFLIEALITLYEATFELRWFKEARTLADLMIEHFADRERGGFFTTADDHERLIVRRKELDDSPIPSGSASAAYGLLRLAALTGEQHYEQSARKTLRLLRAVAIEHPLAFGHLLQAAAFHVTPTKEIALVGDDLNELRRLVRSQFRPFTVLAGGEPDGVPLLSERATLNDMPTAYVCENFTCKAPVAHPAELEELLR